MYKGKLKHVKELLLAFQKLRQASAEMNSMYLSFRNQTGGKEKKAIRKELFPLMEQLYERGCVYSTHAYYFRSLARAELENLKKSA